MILKDALAKLDKMELEREEMQKQLHEINEKISKFTREQFGIAEGDVINVRRFAEVIAKLLEAKE